MRDASDARVGLDDAGLELADGRGGLADGVGELGAGEAAELAGDGETNGRPLTRALGRGGVGQNRQRTMDLSMLQILADF